jgi:hypothetical protein
VALLAAAPMLHWNATNDWLTFRFNFDIRQREQATSIWHPLRFLGLLAAGLTPGFLVLSVLACLRRAARARPPLIAVLFCTLLPLAFFVVVSLRRGVGVHWPAAPLLCALVVLAVAIAMRDPWTHRRWVRIAWWSSWGLSIVILVLAHLFTLMPAHFSRIDLVAGQPRTILRNLFGWRQVGQAAAAAADSLRSQPQSQGVFFMSNQFGTAAAIAFYTPDQPHVHLWSEPRNHGRSYAIWDDWQALRGRDAVYVSKYQLSAANLQHLRQHFAAVGDVERVGIERDGDERNAFFIVCCRGFDGRTPFR